ncbi:hypothetical protein THF5G08_440008 [Vibrio jasicida]|nr:hypothetical protein THF5G08_440008 [Vibrio jasicida]
MQNEQRMMDSMSDMLEQQRKLEVSKQSKLRIENMLYGDGIPLEK